MLSDMTKKDLQAKIKGLQREIASLGPLRPGSLYKRGNVCGRPGCKCGREKDPVKHGPYHYVSYTFRGKSHTEFVSQRKLEAVKEQIRNHKRLMELIDMLVEYNIRLARLPEKET
jgi:hypothetical protein